MLWGPNRPAGDCFQLWRWLDSPEDRRTWTESHKSLDTQGFAPNWDRRRMIALG